ncbi:MAG: LysR family transcriptional regulator [Deltaproteobacteria bacterium]|nr:LysR family transcriptional regulator [Nannocystaceae bacterium]
MQRLDALRLFVRLVERGSFTAAALDMRVKQSTASKWVAELEEQLGVSLVERTTRSIRVTDAGLLLAQRSVEILGAVDAVSAELSGDTDREPMGRVRVSAPVVFGRRFVAPLLAEFLAQHPKVDAELVFGDRYVNLVDQGFDLAIRVGRPTDTSARGRKLADSERCLVASPEYLDRRGAPRTPKDLEHHDCLFHNEIGARATWRFRRGREQDSPVAVTGRIATNNSEVTLEMARRGLGIALLADWLVADDLSTGTLVQLLAGYRAPPAPVCALTPPGRFVTPPVRALLDFLVASLGASNPGGRLQGTSPRTSGPRSKVSRRTV